jgi:hypothetical protein
MGLEQFDTILAFSAVMLTLSLLITIIVQMLLAAFNMRGKGLAWGVERLLQQIDPKLKLGDMAGKLTERVLGHHALAHLGTTRAIAIRKEELIKVLEDLATRPTLAQRLADAVAEHAPSAKDQLAPEVQKLALAPRVWHWWDPRSWPIFGHRLTKELEQALAQAIERHAPKEKDRVLGALKAALSEPGTGLSDDERKKLQEAFAQLAPGADASRVHSALAISGELLKIFPGADAAVRQAVGNAMLAKRKIEAEVEKWFDTVMDRTTERFVLNTRWVTAGVALAMAVGLHIDSLAIFAQLTSSKDLRGQWLEASGGLLKEAEKLAADTEKPWPVGTMAIKAMKDDPKLDAADKKKLEVIPDGMVTRRAGLDWLAEKDVSVPGRQLYAAKVEEVAKKRLDELGGAFTRVRNVAAGTSLQIVPWPRPALSWMTAVGILMSAMLLGLGAPFWFNLLKQLTTLRPLIASKVEGKTPS